MPGKFQEGFTKAAQKQKFIRHRDIKLKEREVKKERNIQKGMCEGVCSRCRDKVQWRFKYDKYKPLKNPAKCQECKQKTVHKAYRTFCDSCSSKKRACPSCCLSYDEIEAARLKDEEEKAAKKTDDNEDFVKIEMEEDEEENDNEVDNEDDDNDNDEMDEENDNVDDKEEVIKATSIVVNDGAQTVFTRTNFSIGNDDKIKDKYSSVLEGKYSKNRVIGGNE